MSGEDTNPKPSPNPIIPNNYFRYSSEYRRVSVDPKVIDPKNRRYSVAPLLDSRKIKEIEGIHRSRSSGTTNEASENGKDEEEFKNSIKPPLQPLDPMEGITIGLELLVDITHILIRQHTETEEALFGVRSVARYDIMDESFNRMYYAWETESSGCGNSRSFTLRVADFSGRPVLVIKRNYSWCNCLMEAINCCGSYGSSVSVTLPDGNLLGKIKQNYNGCTPTFTIRDEFDGDVFLIKGPPGGDWCYGINVLFTEVIFQVFSDMTGEQIGIITKKWPNLFGSQAEQNIEYFGVKIPKDIPPNFKSLLLGAVFTIDAMYFEHDSSKQDMAEKISLNRKK